MADIRIDISKANIQADRLEEAATELRYAALYLNTPKNFSEVWKGKASDAFKTKIEKQREKLYEDSDELKRIADKIRTVAARIKAQEEAAQKAAQAL